MLGISGALVNAFVVIIGGILGSVVGKALSEKIADTVMKGLGLAVILIGISGALEGKRILVTIISLALGALLGEIIDIDRAFNRLSHFTERKLYKKENGTGRFAEGMCGGALLFCVGAMSVVGSLEAGLTGDCYTIYTKSLLDLISSTLLASTLGIGVAFAAVPLLVYQGALTVCANFVAPYLSDVVVCEMTSAGSLIILALGLNMIGVGKFKVANYLPAIFLPIAVSPLYDLISELLTKYF